VKLAAPGDVLRTTAILPALHEKLGSPEVVWVAGRAAVPLLEGNPSIHRIVPFDGAFPAELAVQEFDLVLNPDAAADAAAIATAARAREKRGIGLDGGGRPFPFNPEAEPWLLAGLDDRRKKENRRGYAEILHEMFLLGEPRSRPLLNLRDEEIERARALLARLGLGDGRRIVGLNTGAGSRWPLKKWTFEGFRDLARALARRGLAVLLLGGPDEVERNRALAAETDGAAADAGCGHPVRDFAAIVSLCDVVVTGDTLALHLATALGRPVVAIFGPTSAAEIDLAGGGEKVVSETLDCLVCYKTACDFDPNCMNTIPASRVEEAVLRWVPAR
jgi:heptosyltransferase-2